MSSDFPGWLLPLLILGVPLALAIVERMRTPGVGAADAEGSHRAFTAG